MTNFQALPSVAKSETQNSKLIASFTQKSMCKCIICQNICETKELLLMCK